MSTAIDNFTSQLHDNLEAVEDRAKALNQSIKSATKKNQAEIQLKTAAETKRTIFHPHAIHKERRLACQTKVLGDLLVTKFDGYFGDGDEFIWTPGGLLAAPALT